VTPKFSVRSEDIETAWNLRQGVHPGKTHWMSQASDAEYAEGPASEGFRVSAEP